jgi:hypothetical protein
MSSFSSVLKPTLALAQILRDSQEGKNWRNAWRSLGNLEPPKSANFDFRRMPLTEFMAMARRSEQGESRPMMYCLLLSEPPLNLQPQRITAELAGNPVLRNTFHQLVGCLGCLTSIVGFLRSIAPGYPHPGLIYTLRETHWAHLSSKKELPWSLSIIPAGHNDAGRLRFEQFVPTVEKETSAAINALVATVRESPVYLALRNAHSQISRRPNLLDELERAKTEFQSRTAQIDRSRLPRPVWMEECEHMVRDIYDRRGPRILSYVKAFLEFEQLVESVYWIISQLAMFEAISCLTTNDPQQIQQVQCDIGEEPFISAVAPTQARTLQVGQLVHIAFPGTDHLLDGIYQIRYLHLYYAIESGARIFLHGPRLWHCPEEALKEFATTQPPIFLPSELGTVLGDMKVAISKPDGSYMTMDVRDEIPRLQFTKTMYLP